MCRLSSACIAFSSSHVNINCDWGSFATATSRVRMLQGFRLDAAVALAGTDRDPAMLVSTCCCRMTAGIVVDRM
jgi:hypothetical protein